MRMGGKLAAGPAGWDGHEMGFVARPPQAGRPKGGGFASRKGSSARLCNRRAWLSSYGARYEPASSFREMDQSYTIRPTPTRTHSMRAP
jgi:hypothetical protein